MKKQYTTIICCKKGFAFSSNDAPIFLLFFMDLCKNIFLRPVEKNPFYNSSYTYEMIFYFYSNQTLCFLFKNVTSFFMQVILKKLSNLSSVVEVYWNCLFLTQNLRKMYNYSLGWQEKLNCVFFFMSENIWFVIIQSCLVLYVLLISCYIIQFHCLLLDRIRSFSIIRFSSSFSL